MSRERTAFGISSLQIWDDPEEDPRTKGFSLQTSEGFHHYIATREQLLTLGEELVKTAKAMPALFLASSRHLRLIIRYQYPDRVFRVPRPNVLWVSDFTYVA